MRTPLALLSLVALLQAPAQIIIGPDDMPSAGDTMRYRSTTAADIDLVLTGDNVVWDFSDITLGAVGADTAVGVTSTPAAYQFFFNNNFIFPDHRADFALKGTGFGFQGFSFDDVFNYYKKGGTGYRDVGFGANLNGIPTSIRRVPVDFIHNFPLEYGDMDTSFSSFNVTIPTLGYYKQDQWRYSTVDGWGQLVLPGFTFDVLRVRAVLEQRDSIYVDQFGFGFATDRPETVEYRWVAAGMDAPVLIVTTVAGVATTARVFDGAQVGVGIADGPKSEGVSLWPNPADATVHIRLPDRVNGAAVVYDAQGREVYRSGAHRAGELFTIPVEGLSPGAYTVQIGDDGRSWSKRFVVRH